LAVHHLPVCALHQFKRLTLPYSLLAYFQLYGEHLAKPLPTHNSRKRLPNLAEALQAVTNRIGPIGMLGVALTGGGLLIAIGYIVGLGTNVFDQTVAGPVGKEVGLAYAPNWIIVYMVLFPLYLFAFGLMLNARDAFFKQGTQIPQTRFITGPKGVAIGTNRVREIWQLKLRDLSLFLYFLLVGVIILSFAQWVLGGLLLYLNSLNDFGNLSLAERAKHIIGDQVIDWSTAAYIGESTYGKLTTLLFSTYAYAYMALALFLYLAVFAWFPHFSYFLMQVSDETLPVRIILRGAELADCYRKFLSILFATAVLGLSAAYLMSLQANYLNSSETWVVYFAFQEFEWIFGGKQWFKGQYQPDWLPASRQIASMLTSRLEYSYTLLMYLASVTMMSMSFNRSKQYYLRKIGDPSWRRETGIQYDASFVAQVRQQTFTSQVMPGYLHMYFCIMLLTGALAFPWFGSLFIAALLYAVFILLRKNTPKDQLKPVENALPRDSELLKGVMIESEDAAEIALLFQHHATCFISANQFYTSAVERSDIPDEYREHIKAKLSAVAPGLKATELVRLAADQGYMPLELTQNGRNSTILGSILLAMLSRVGLEFQCFIVEKLGKCALVADVRTLAELNYTTCQRWDFVQTH
jgi:hypothetical protein